jgi:hypothetical protein
MFTFPGIPYCCCGAVKLVACGQPPTGGQDGVNASRFPRLIHGGTALARSGGDRRSRLSTIHSEPPPQIVGRKRIERVMRQHGIRARAPRRYRVCTTDSKHSLPVAPNLLDQNFVADRPNKVWLATYIATGEGWLYLAAILGLRPHARRAHYRRAHHGDPAVAPGSGADPSFRVPKDLPSGRIIRTGRVPPTGSAPRQYAAGDLSQYPARRHHHPIDEPQGKLLGITRLWRASSAR